MHTDERALIARLAAGEERAFAQVYDRYCMALYGYLVARTRRPDAAEDLLQEVMLRLARSRRSGKSGLGIPFGRDGSGSWSTLMNVKGRCSSSRSMTGPAQPFPAWQTILSGLSFSPSTCFSRRAT